MASQALMNTYGTRTISFTHGEGVYLYDDEGKQYLDALSGIAVCGLGHAHPAVARAIAEQAGKVLHTSNLYNIPNQEALGNRLQALSGMDRIFFSNSGAEANEAAIKLARLRGNQKGISNPTIVVMENAFHGRTMATLTATGNSKVQVGFEPLLSGFVRVPFDDVNAIKAIADNSDIVAVMVEPVQGEGGVHIPNADYLPQLRQLCDEHDWWLILDEVQTGNGRCGNYFAYQNYGIVPDIVTTAKGLGNGVPIGACMAKGAAAELFQPGNHGSTFGGNPLACAAGLAVLDVLEQEQLPQRAQQLGERLVAGFKEQLADQDAVKEIRNLGLIVGIELTEPCTELVVLAAESGLLINVTAGSVIRLLPPLTLTDQQADTLVETLSSLVTNWIKR